MNERPYIRIKVEISLAASSVKEVFGPPNIFCSQLEALWLILLDDTRREVIILSNFAPTYGDARTSGWFIWLRSERGRMTSFTAFCTSSGDTSSRPSNAADAFATLT